MKRNTYSSLDRLGIFTSVLCAIHCTLLPVLISSLPFLGIDILENPWIEWSMMLAALVFGIFSLYHGYSRHHHKKMPVFLFVAGFTSLMLNQVTEERLIFLFIPVSAICIITAHCLNIYYCRNNEKCKPDVGNSVRTDIG